MGQSRIAMFCDNRRVVTGRMQHAISVGVAVVNRQLTSRFEDLQFLNQRHVPGRYLVEHDPPRTKLHCLEVFSWHTASSVVWDQSSRSTFQ